MNDILVSIVCMTYNHECFIGDALEGMLQQDVDFAYEIIVHDDASTDKTPQIIREYKERYPETIRDIYESENQFSRRGVCLAVDLYKLCRGKYIAFCEGDDFWIDRHKLKIQVKWMEEHPDFFLTAHNALRINYTDNAMQSMNPYMVETEISPEELIMQYHGNLPSASLIMRSEIKGMEELFMECGVGDIPLQCYSISKGRVYYFDRIMSVYRYNHSASWCKSTLGNNKEKIILHYAKMIRFTYKYDQYMQLEYSNYLYDLRLRYVWYIMEYCRDLSLTDFRGKMQGLMKKEGDGLEEYFYDISEAFELLHNENYISEKLLKFMRNRQHIYIWGTGHYGTLLAKKFICNRLKWDGFIISDISEGNREYMGKKVHNIAELSKTTESLCIIVAVNIAFWKDIKELLEKHKILSYSHMICVQGGRLIGDKDEPEDSFNQHYSTSI